MGEQGVTEIQHDRTFTEKLLDLAKNPYVDVAVAAVGIAAIVASRGELAGAAEKYLPEFSCDNLGRVFGIGDKAERGIFAGLTSHLPEEEREAWKSVWAKNSDDPALLNELAANDPQSHRLLLENNNLPPSALNKIAEMRAEAPTPEYKPDRILWGEQLAAHKAAAKVVEDARDIRQLVALHPNADESVLNKLALDKITRVRAAIPENPNVTSDTLHILARQNAKNIYSVASDSGENFAMQARIAAHPNASEGTMLELAKSPTQATFESTDSSVMTALLENPKTPDRVLRVLREKESISSISPGIEIARHPNASPELLSDLWQSHPTGLLQKVIRSHPNITPELEEMVMAKGWSWQEHDGYWLFVGDE
jgi:hypothetical protein